MPQFCHETAPETILEAQNIKLFSWGACPQTPLAARFVHYMETYANGRKIRIESAMDDPSGLLNAADRQGKFYANACAMVVHDQTMLFANTGHF